MNYNYLTNNIERLPALDRVYNSHNETIGDIVKILSDAKYAEPDAKLEMYQIIEQLKKQYPHHPNKDIYLLAKLTFDKNRQARSIQYNRKFVPKPTGRFERDYYPSNSATAKVFNYIIHNNAAKENDQKYNNLRQNIAENILRKDHPNPVIDVPQNNPIERLPIQPAIVEVPVQAPQPFSPFDASVRDPQSRDDLIAYFNEIGAIPTAFEKVLYPERYDDDEYKYDDDESDIEEFDINDDPLAAFGNGKPTTISRSQLNRVEKDNNIRQALHDNAMEELNEAPIIDINPQLANNHVKRKIVKYNVY